MSDSKHAGGRPHGSRSRANDGLFKECDCSHRKWAKCKHSWYFNFRYDGTNHRFSLYKHFRKPRGYWMSKSEAEGLRDALRDLIRKGKFNASSPTPTTAAPDGPLTLRAVAKLYHEHCSTDPSRRAHRLPILQKALDVICRTIIDGQPFGDKAIEAIIKPDLEKFRGARRVKFRAEDARLKERRARIAAKDPEAHTLTVSSELPHAKKGEVGINRSLELLRAVLNWAIDCGYRAAISPFTQKQHGRPAFEFADEQGRERRLEPGEEERFRAHAGLHLLALFIAGVETGMRREEALSLQWKHIQTHTIKLQAENTKEGKPRSIQISMPLRALLDMRRHAPDGTEHGPDAFVFGNEVGEKQDSIKTAWNATCRRAKISNLHFHDLRHEASSRWHENGVPLHLIQKWLGHANISQTSTYLASTAVGEREAMDRYDAQRTAALLLTSPPRKTAKKARPEARVH